MRVSIFLLVTILLGGCAQYNERQQAAAVQAQSSNDDARCRSYGTEPGSSGYIQCRMNLDQLHAQEAQQRRAILGAYLLNHR
ncbi:MAG TPA: hypothetical protein VFX37_10455 [Pseudolabrys sp.]|nr:hypothetical protein [Pseudolabrys sp.]